MPAGGYDFSGIDDWSRYNPQPYDPNYINDATTPGGNRYVTGYEDNPAYQKLAAEISNGGVIPSWFKDAMMMVPKIMLTFGTGGAGGPLAFGGENILLDTAMRIAVNQTLNAINNSGERIIDDNVYSGNVPTPYENPVLDPAFYDVGPIQNTGGGGGSPGAPTQAQPRLIDRTTTQMPHVPNIFDPVPQTPRTPQAPPPAVEMPPRMTTPGGSSTPQIGMPDAEHPWIYSNGTMTNVYTGETLPVGNDGAVYAEGGFYSGPQSSPNSGLPIIPNIPNILDPNNQPTVTPQPAPQQPAPNPPTLQVPQQPAPNPPVLQPRPVPQAPPPAIEIPPQMPQVPGPPVQAPPAIEMPPTTIGPTIPGQPAIPGGPGVIPDIIGGGTGTGGGGIVGGNGGGGTGGGTGGGNGTGAGPGSGPGTDTPTTPDLPNWPIFPEINFPEPPTATIPVFTGGPTYNFYNPTRPGGQWYPGMDFNQQAALLMQGVSPPSNFYSLPPMETPFGNPLGPTGYMSQRSFYNAPVPQEPVFTIPEIGLY